MHDCACAQNDPTLPDTDNLRTKDRKEYPIIQRFYCTYVCMCVEHLGCHLKNCTACSGMYSVCTLVSQYCCSTLLYGSFACVYVHRHAVPCSGFVLHAYSCKYIVSICLHGYQHACVRGCKLTPARRPVAGKFSVRKVKYLLLFGLNTKCTSFWCFKYYWASGKNT